MELGDRIKYLRELNGIDRADLAPKIGVTYHALSKYETNERQPDYDTLLRIADYFNVTTDYLLGRRKDREQNKFKKLFQQFIALMKDERGAGTTENMGMILFELLKLSASMNGVPLTAMPAIELSESKKQTLIKELDNIAEAEENDSVKEMAEQIRELSPRGQAAIKSMLEALKSNDEKAAVNETDRHLELLAAHRDDNPMDDLPDDAMRSVKAAQKAYLDEFKQK